MKSLLYFSLHPLYVPALPGEIRTNEIAAFVKSPQNVMCPVLGNRLFNPENVHGLLRNSATNF